MSGTICHSRITRDQNRIVFGSELAPRIASGPMQVERVLPFTCFMPKGFFQCVLNVALEAGR